VERPVAAERSAIGTVTLSRGGWGPSSPMDGHAALYVLNGLIARRVLIEGRSATELLGPGTLLRPGFAVEETIAIGTAWRVLGPTWVGILDGAFWNRMSAYPSVWLRLLDRELLRSRSLCLRLAIVRIPNLATRVLLLLWHLADSYGSVSDRGVTVHLPLSHETLAELVSASRPSVSRAVKQLERSGRVSRAENRDYVLHGRFSAYQEGGLPRRWRLRSLLWRLFG
jgi:CRP/FNR family cyclic AMP-dependent transcriptional regulator